MIATTYVLVGFPALIQYDRRTAVHVVVQSLIHQVHKFLYLLNRIRIYKGDTTSLVDRTALGKLAHISLHSFPATPAVLAERQRTSSVTSQSAAGI
jgi:hypothetical protein